MSDSLRAHGLQPTRLLHPWDSPGKSTGVGSHCPLPTVDQMKPNSLVPLADLAPGSSYHVSLSIQLDIRLETFTKFLGHSEQREAHHDYKEKDVCGEEDWQDGRIQCFWASGKCRPWPEELPWERLGRRPQAEGSMRVRSGEPWGTSLSATRDYCVDAEAQGGKRDCPSEHE